MNKIERLLSRPTAKPYRSDGIDPAIEPHFNQDGVLDFAPGDIENPKEWSVGRKTYITIASVLLVLNATFASSAPSACLTSITTTFNVSREAAALVITIFLLGYCSGPLLFAPLSEFYGRRWVFCITFGCYIAFNFLCAFAPNFASLLIGRLLSGTFASAALTNAPGVLADIWDPVNRANAMALFSVFTFCGPAAGPVIAGFLEVTRDWRWAFYVHLWLAALTIPFLITIPETHPPTVLMNKARRLRRLNPEKYGHIQSPAEAQGRNLAAIFKVALLRPWQILLDLISFLVAIYMSVVYMLLYMLFTIYPIVFQQKRGWNAGVGELPLIGTVVGGCIGGCIVLWGSHRDRIRIQSGRPLKPEDRLGLAMIAGIMFPITMFWFAWTANFNSIHWIVPTIAGMFLSTSILLIFVGYINYLTDSYLMYTASAMAANTICRSACGAAAPLFTEQMFTALGVGGGGSLIAGVATLLAPIPFVFYKYGERIRVKSRFAPTPHVQQQKDEERSGEKDEEKAASNQQNPMQRQDSVASESTIDDSNSTLQLPMEKRETEKDSEREGDRGVVQ